MPPNASKIIVAINVSKLNLNAGIKAPVSQKRDTYPSGNESDFFFM